VKRDTELWLLVREIRAEYHKLAAMMVRWEAQLTNSEYKLRAILDDPDAQAPQAETRLADDGDAYDPSHWAGGVSPSTEK
jgi:hypothetical protein